MLLSNNRIQMETRQTSFCNATAALYGFALPPQIDMEKIARQGWCTLIATLLLNVTAFAQSPGAIAVDVIDESTRRPIAGVLITVTARNGDAVSARTDEQGAAELDGLVPGLYQVESSDAGYRRGFEPSVRVVTRRTTPVQMQLVASAEAIDEVTVRARAVRADVFGAVSNSYLNREELRSAVGTGSDVMRALDGLPGLISTGDFANFTVRGRGPRDNLIFVDGMPFDKVVHFDQTLGEEEDIGGGGRFSIFAPNSIRGAEFSPGGWSAAYGGRSGSLLQLDVAGGLPTPSASMRVDIAGLEFMYEGPSGIHENTTAFFTARQFDFGRVFEFIDEEDIGTPELTDIILKTETEIDGRNSVEFLAIHAPEEYTRDIDNVLASPDFEDVSLIESEQDLSLFGLSWIRLVGETGQWTNRLYLRDSDKESAEGESFPDLVPEDTPPEDIPVNERIITVGEKESEIGWRSDFIAQNRWGTGSVGLRLTQIDVDYRTFLREDWTRFVYRSTDPRPPGQDFIVLQPENVNSEFDASEVSYAVYGEQTFEFDSWDLRAGLRYDYDGFAEQSLVSPRFAANFRPAAGRRISATAGVFFQSPRFLDRAASEDNFAIQNERITHFSVGFSQDFGSSWNVLVEPYYQQLDDLVTDTARTDGRVTNDGDGRSYGVDVVVSRYFRDGWSANAAYSYNNLTRNDNDGQGDYDADFSRPHFFTVGGSWEITDRWKVGARWKYASGRPTDAFVINDDVLGPGEPLRFSKELTDQNADQLEDYHSLNVRVDYRRTLGPLGLVAFVDVINVYGGPNTNSQEFDPRRGINIVDDDGAFPLIGLIFERTW